MKSWCVACLMAMVLAGSALAAGWQAYVNVRFGAAADVPADYKAGEAPADGDGLTFTSPDGEARILIWGGLATVTDENFTDYVKRLVTYDRDDGWDVSYSAGKGDWFAFSGVKASRIFYEKVIKACNGQIANHVRLEYPTTRKKEFDPIVAHVAKSLRSERGWQC